MDKDGELDRIKAAQESWAREKADEFKQERKADFVSLTGIPIKRVYTPLDLEEKGFDYLKDVGFPGSFPYTRGISSTGYRGKLPGIVQYSGHPTPEQSNALWKANIAAGATGPYIAFDLPTQLGYDPDDPMAEGEVGRVGVSLASLRDWEVAFDGIDTGNVSVAMVANANAATAIASFLAIAERQGMPIGKLRGFCQNDILKEYIARGAYIFPPKPSIRLVIDILSYSSKHLPEYRPITVIGGHYTGRGATPVQEAAYTLAMCFEYLAHAVQMGIDVDAIAPVMMFTHGWGHQNFFEEIAKARAFRKIYAKTMRDQFKAQKPESLWAECNVGASGLYLSKQQYLNNIVRGAYTALGMMLAGVQGLDTRAYDEGYGIPTQEATLTAIRTRQIAIHEMGLCDTVDPLAGSYYVEWLTSEIEQRILRELDVIARQGGVIACIDNGYFQRAMSAEAYKWQKAFERGDAVQVGVNSFTSETEERPMRIQRTDPKIEKERVAAVKELRRTRDNKKVASSIERLQKMASMPGTVENNLMPAFVEAVKSYATVGEIHKALREVWGEYTEAKFL